MTLRSAGPLAESIALLDGLDGVAYGRPPMVLSNTQKGAAFKSAVPWLQDLKAKYFKQQVPRGRAPLVQRTVLRLHFDLHVLIASLARRVKTPPGWQTDERHELKKEKDDFELEKTAVAAGEQYSLQVLPAACSVCQLPSV